MMIIYKRRTLSFFLSPSRAISINTSSPLPPLSPRRLSCGKTSPTSSIWYSSLDTYVFPDAPTSGLAVASKVLADQILWAPVLISCLFAFDLAFDASETKKPSLSKKIENDLLSALKVNWSFWPLFHLFSFRYVSTEDRILYINCVQIAFNVFLVYTSSRREEEKEEPKNQNRGS